MEKAVISILNEYLKFGEKYNYQELSRGDKDKIRFKNDSDAKYYHEVCDMRKDESLKADTIISF